MRHYAVQASAANVSKPVKRVVEVKTIPDLSKLKDISEYVTRIDPGSDSEGEDAVAPMAGKFGGRGNVAKRESKIKLVELGPRLRLRLYKVERCVYHRKYIAWVEEHESLPRKVGRKPGGLKRRT